jgi:membrane protein
VEGQAARQRPARIRGRIERVDKLAPVRRFDRLQRGHPALAVPLAVLKKVSDDSAGNYAALIAYYAFLSLFPLLLLAVAILGFVAHGDASARQTIAHSGLPNIANLRSSLAHGHLRGSGVGIVIGALGSLWAGLGVTMILQTTFNQIYGVPYDRRPNFIKVRLRGLRLLLTVGVLQIAATAIAGLATGGGGTLLVIAGFVVSMAFNVLLFFLAFRQLTTETVPTRALWAGIIFAAIGWELLQTIGTVYVNHVVHNAGATYGTFATVIGLLAWLYLGARVIVYGAELNSVLEHHYWPRSLLEPRTPADDAVHRALAEEQERERHEDVNVTFDSPAEAVASPSHEA